MKSDKLSIRGDQERQNKPNFGFFSLDPSPVEVLLELKGANLEGTVNVIVITKQTRTVSWSNSEFEQMTGNALVEIVEQGTRMCLADPGGSAELIRHRAYRNGTNLMESPETPSVQADPIVANLNETVRRDKKQTLIGEPQ
jgi:hypothetical protein